MAKMYLVRHGQTVLNVEKRVQGWMDSPLTETGVQQAEEAARWFEENGIDFAGAYTSDLGRAIATMQIILSGRPGVPMRALKGLREMYFGQLDGSPGSVLGEVDYQANAKKYGGEDFIETARRVIRTLARIAAAEQDHTGNILVISHSSAMYSIYPFLDKKEGFDWPQLMPVPNGTIFQVDGNGSRLVLEGVRLPDGTVCGQMSQGSKVLDRQNMD